MIHGPRPLTSKSRPWTGRRARGVDAWSSGLSARPKTQTQPPNVPSAPSSAWLWPALAGQGQMSDVGCQTSDVRRQTSDVRRQTCTETWRSPTLRTGGREWPRALTFGGSCRRAADGLTLTAWARLRRGSRSFTWHTRRPCQPRPAWTTGKAQVRPGRPGGSSCRQRGREPARGSPPVHPGWVKAAHSSLPAVGANAPTAHVSEGFGNSRQRSTAQSRLLPGTCASEFSCRHSLAG